MGYFRFLYQRIKALVKATHKLLKVFLILKVKKPDPTFLTPKLGKFPIFNNFFF